MFSFGAHANNWQEFGKDSNGHIHYVDTDNIEEVMALSIIGALWIFETTTLGTRSNVSKHKVDCAKKTNLLSGILYESMGKGKEITSLVPVWNQYGPTLNEIRSLTPDSIEYRLMQFVCEKKM